MQLMQQQMQQQQDTMRRQAQQAAASAAQANAFARRIKRVKLWNRTSATHKV